MQGRKKRQYVQCDFNISHSGDYVICVLGEGLRLGIDIEEWRDIDFDHFRKVMTNEQWGGILHSSNFTKSFFKYWTIKESVIKAEGKGLSIPLLNLHVNNNSVQYDNQMWYLNKLDIDDKYSTRLATNKKNVYVKMSELDFWNKE